MTEKSLTIALIVVAIIAIGGYFFPQVQAILGATGTRFPNGISADSTSPVAGEVRGTTGTLTSSAAITGDVTLGGGSGALVLTTTNAATSTVAVGCVQTYATSTANPIKLMFHASSTFSVGDQIAIATGFGGGTMQGIVLWGFGTCP